MVRMNLIGAEVVRLSKILQGHGRHKRRPGVLAVKMRTKRNENNNGKKSEE